MKYKYALLTLALSFNTSVFAVDLWQAWTAAREHSAQYSASSHQREATYEKENQAFAQLLPQISANAHYNNTLFDSHRQSSGWGIELKQAVFNKGKWSQYEAEKITTDLADSTFAKTDAELLLQVAKQYLTILTLNDKLQAIESEKSAYQLQIKRANALFKGGQATKVDYYDAQSGYDLALAKETNLKTQLIVAQNSFSNMTGLSPEDIQPIKIKTLPNWASDNKEEYWLKLAFENNPELYIRNQEVVKSAADLKTIEDSRYPTVDLTIGYQDKYSKTDDYTGREIRQHDENAYIGLQMSVQLYTGGYTTSRIRENKHILQQQTALLEETHRQTVLNVRQAYAKLQGQQTQIKAQQRLLETNKLKLDAVILGRDYGVRDSVDEVQAERDYASAKEQLAEARYGYIEAYLQLLYVTGQLNKEKGKQTVMGLF